MLKRATRLSALVLIGCSGVATGQTTPAPVQTTGVVATAAPVPKRICRSIVPTGSVMPKRFCMTAPEWRTFNGLNQDNANTAMQRRQSGMCNTGAGGCLPSN